MCPQACPVHSGVTLAQIEAALKTDLTFEYQADAVLNQAIPVQNTWYTILNTVINARLHCIVIRVNTANETLECRITIDGNILTASQAAIFGTYYYVFQIDYLGTTTSETNAGKFTFLECRSVKVEMRKTTNVGAGTLIGRVVYSKRT